jgi:uncharacterized protein
MLDSKGNPEIVARSLIAPPMAQVGPISEDERQQLIRTSALADKYDTGVDRESAFEILRDRKLPVGEPQAGSSSGGLLGSLEGALGKLFGPRTGRGRERMSTGEIALRSAVQSAARAAGTQIGRAILRGILGGKSR